jgi:hypothetical protein
MHSNDVHERGGQGQQNSQIHGLQRWEGQWLLFGCAVSVPKFPVRFLGNIWSPVNSANIF